jgi:hypothetical protein
MDDVPVHPSLLALRRRNQETSGNWELFASHRQRVTELLVRAGAETPGPQRRLTVLGAGNSNDLDLIGLRAAFASVCLVDWDAAALSEGLARQGFNGDSGVRTVGEVDLAGVAEATRDWPRNAPPSNEQIEQAIVAARSALTIEPESCEVAASVGLLSQIIDGVVRSAGCDHVPMSHPRMLELIQALRYRHLEILTELLVPGGWGVLICDFVSSETAPQIVSAEDFALPALLGELIARGNFFTGLNPAVIHSLLTTHDSFRRRIDQVAVLLPWTWNLGPRWYAVFAIRFRRRAVES